MAGIRFDVCHSAEEACERVLAPGVEYLAVLTDVNMSGMDGIEFCTWMSKHRPDTAVVVMTAFTSMESAVSAMRAGAVDYIQKPLHMEGTVNRMRRVIDARQLRMFVLDEADHMIDAQGMGTQTMPVVWRTMKPICSGVTLAAATIRSPSFSRSSSSTTTTISPLVIAATASDTGSSCGGFCWLLILCIRLC